MRPSLFFADPQEGTDITSNAEPRSCTVSQSHFGGGDSRWRSGKRATGIGSAATENILLAACAHGLGSCWVAGDKKPYAPEICRLVGAPRGYKLVSLIPIGYPAESPEKSNQPLSSVLHWEKY